MKNHLLLLFFFPFSILAQKIKFDATKFKSNLIKTDTIKAFTIPNSNANTSSNLIIQKIATRNIISNKVNARFSDLLKKLNINLNPANTSIAGNYLSCCNCCTESNPKTFSANGVYTFTPNNNGYSTTSFTINAFAGVQYLVRITGSTNQSRNFTVSFGSSNNTQGYKVPANNFEITFIAKPQTSGNFFFTLYSNEPGIWSFYNCSVTEL